MAQGTTKGVPIDIDPTLSNDSDLLVPSQKAIKTYVDNGLANKQNALTLTTTGTSGAATLAGNVLNIPQYSGGSPSSPVSPGYGLQELVPSVLSVDTSVIATTSSLSSYYPITNPSGYISGITSGDITTALGYTPATQITTINTTGPLLGGGNLSSNRTLSINQANTLTDGYLAASDYANFNGKQDALISGTNIKTINSSSLLGSGNILVGTITSVTGTTPILSSGGTTPAISIANAVADGTTKGAATFTASDFNDDGSGLISIDYTNGQAASGSTKGFLTSADWTTFNDKLNPATAAATYVKLAGDTMTGLLQFSGTTHAGIRLINLTTAQRNALTPTAGMIVFDTDISEFCHYNGAGWEYDLNKSVASNVTTNVTGAANITGLSFSVEANSTFLVDCYYNVSCTGTGGIRFTQTTPAGATMDITYDGIAGTAISSVKIRSAASGTLTATAINSAAITSSVIVRGFVRTNANAGTLQMQFASNTNGQTSTIFARSWAKITRIV